MKTEEREFGPTEEQLDPKHAEEAEDEFLEAFRRNEIEPTQPAPLPYKGAPLSTYDLVMQQVRFEEQFFPHLEYVHSEEAMRKELPSQKWSPAARVAFGNGIIRFVLAMTP